MTPLARAVDLVDHDAGQPPERVALLQLGDEALALAHLLRSHVEQPEGPSPRARHVRVDPVDLLARGGRGEHGGLDAQGLHGQELVLHEGDEGGDDQGESGGDEGGELVTEALPRTRGHDEDHVASGEEGVDAGALEGTEGVHLEAGLEEGGGTLAPREGGVLPVYG